MKKFFSELRRRRVIQVSLAYIIIGWALIEAAATLFPMFEAPEWMPRAFTMIVALGFPIAVILAWAVQVTPHGIVVEARDGAAEQGKIHFVTSFDGAQIAYALCGNGPPIVKAAHWLTDLELDWQTPVWRHWLTSLSDGMQLLRYDERGCGLSDRDVEDISLDAMVNDLECVIDAAGFERFALLGSSQGGPVSIAYAVRHPQKVRALILYGSYAQGLALNATDEELKRREATLELVRLGWGDDNPAYVQMFGSQFIPDANDEQRQAFQEMARESATPEMAARLLISFGDLDVSGLLTQLSMPVLVLHARDDARIPHERGRKLASGIPGAEFRTLEGRNHIILEHEPAFEQFNSAIREFLDRHPI
jgi:pimeloyl-ACP methyl ester carboxylesterase